MDTDTEGEGKDEKNELPVVRKIATPWGLGRSRSADSFRRVASYGGGMWTKALGGWLLNVPHTPIKEDEQTYPAPRASLRGRMPPSGMIVHNEGATDAGCRTRYLTGADILPSLKTDFERSELSIRGFQYQIDHKEACSALLKAIKRGVSCRIILDKKNFYCSSCVNQAERVEELWRAGCQLRVVTPKGGNWASMHAKTWIIDGAIAYVGSSNLTQNGMGLNKETHKNKETDGSKETFQGNKEITIKVTERSCVADAVKDFENCWEEMQIVDQQMINTMKDKNDVRSDKKKKRSTSSPVKREMRRSLEEELEEVISTGADLYATFDEEF